MPPIILLLRTLDACAPADASLVAGQEKRNCQIAHPWYQAHACLNLLLDVTIQKSLYSCILAANEEAPVESAPSSAKVTGIKASASAAPAGEWSPLVLWAQPTPESFEENAYLDANPDVAAAVRSGRLASGRVHFDAFGEREARRQRIPNAMIEVLRHEKLRKLEPLLRTDMPHSMRGGRPNFLSDELIAETRIVETENVSANAYDQATIDLVERHKSGLVLDCGAGRRDVYYPNVVNFEIVAYDTTDVLGVGEALPFQDSSFDAVISLAVLEHVRDPIKCASEIARVLKPGGELLCATPFLQPLHGYPHHYFNMTSQGLARLFEDRLTIESLGIPPGGHPAFALHWILTSWAADLSGDERRSFTEVTFGNIVENTAQELAERPFSRLSERTAKELACSFIMSASKPAHR